MPSVHRVVAAAVYDERSLKIPTGFTWDDWLREVQDIQWRHRAILWHLGDAFLWGESRFGEMYAQAVDNYSEESITRAMSVCREFPPQRRRAIGFSFHQGVMVKSRKTGKRLFTPEQEDALLDLAVEQKLTREAFRELIKERREALDPAAIRPSDTGSADDASRSDEIAGENPALPTNPDDPVSTEPLDRQSVDHADDEGPRIIKVAELINLFPNQEPAPAPMSADDAASLLLSATRGNRLPSDIIEAILIVLQDRDRLLAEAALPSARDRA